MPRRPAWLIPALILATAALLAGALGIALHSQSRRVETFGLARLVDAGEEPSGGVVTPLQRARERFKEEYRLQPDDRRAPEIVGLKLMMRAINEFNVRERDIAIRDAGRFFQDHPEAKPQIDALVDTYLANNPQLVESGAGVRRAVRDYLADPASRRWGFPDS